MHAAVTAHASNSTAYRVLFTTRSEHRRWRIARVRSMSQLSSLDERHPRSRNPFFPPWINKTRPAVLIPLVKSHPIQGVEIATRRRNV
jgi:hypothetical protein